MNDAAEILNGAGPAGPKGAEELLPLVYQELRRLAAAKMAREAPGQTLQPTALVHEAWLRLSKQSRVEWQNRDHFFAMAAEVMRRLLVERARRRRTGKHGGDWQRTEFDAMELPSAGNDDLLLQVHEVLERLAAEDPQKAEVVKLRFFVGLENTEVAALLGVSEKTVRRHWAFSKAWLARAIKQDAGN